ncbi:MAG: hypothetical protein ACRDPY_25385 [Streptosporangiaceae bacterium]
MTFIRHPLLPDWRERCPACTSYQIRHQWDGTGTLPSTAGHVPKALALRLRSVQRRHEQQPRPERIPYQ